MVSAHVSASLQQKKEDPTKAAMRGKVEELTDSIASAEKKLEACAVLFGKIERQLSGISELRDLLNQASRLILPEGRDPLTGSGQTVVGDGPRDASTEPGLIGRSLNLLAGMLSDSRRGAADPKGRSNDQTRAHGGH